MTDFVAFAREFGLPLASYLVAILVMSRVIVSVTREKDRIGESRYSDMKLQFEARLREQREQYDARIAEIVEDRDWNRDRLHQALGVTDAGTATVEEVIRRISKQLPPRARG